MRSAWTQSSCGVERADDKHLAVSSRATLQKIAAAPWTTRGRIAFWPTLPMPARQGEVRSSEMACCKDRRCRGSRAFLLSLYRCPAKIRSVFLSRTKMNRVRQNESQQLECGVFRFRGLVEFRSGWILIKNEAVSLLSIEFA